MHKLPSFSSLRAFEAVAETLSFTAAAKNLTVTQAAVSRQVKNLENELGVTLLNRLPAGNNLTPNGHRLYRGLRDGLDTIDAAVRSVSTHPGRVSLTVSVAPFFSANWLSPRIMTFIDRHPDIDLRLHHSYQPPDYQREQVDLGINWGTGIWKNVEAVKVLDGTLIPLCAPSFIQSAGPFMSAEDIAKAPLFCEFAMDDWRQWFSMSVVQSESLNITRIDDSHALRRVALEGHGIALFFKSLAQEDLEFGRLVQPLPHGVNTGYHYFLNYPKSRDLSRAAKIFRRWLLAEAENCSV